MTVVTRDVSAAHATPAMPSADQRSGGMIVTPTKVGYIIMVSDFIGLQRKFTAKQRSLNKPGVVLCTSIGQLHELAELNNEIKALYQTAPFTTLNKCYRAIRYDGAGRRSSDDPSFG